MTVDNSGVTLAMPTLDSADVIRETLAHAATAAGNADVDIKRLHVVDGGSADGTVDFARECANEHEWNAVIEETGGGRE